MHFDFRGLHMQVSKGYLELPCDVIPVGLQVYAVCYWLSAGLMVNHIQIVSPKMDWCLDSPLNKSCFPKAWKEFFVLSWLTRHTNISIRMVSKKLSVNVQLEKRIFSHAVSLSSALFFSPCFSFPFFFNLPNFCLPAQIQTEYFFLHERLSKSWRRVRLHPTDIGKSWT